MAILLIPQLNATVSFALPKKKKTHNNADD